MSEQQKTESPDQSAHRKKKTALIRQCILVVVLVLMIAAFLYDKYVLLPSANEKINKVMNEVSLKISDKNREQVNEIVQIEPANTFEHNGIEIAQYRFPRALPFLKRPPLDVGYKGDAIAVLRQEPITKEYLDNFLSNNFEIDRSKNTPGKLSEYEDPR